MVPFSTRLKSLYHGLPPIDFLASPPAEDRTVAGGQRWEAEAGRNAEWGSPGPCWVPGLQVVGLRRAGPTSDSRLGAGPQEFLTVGQGLWCAGV